MEDVTWDKGHLERLTHLSEAMGPELGRLLPELGTHQQRQLMSLTSAVQDMLSLGQLSLLGYDAALAGHDSFGKMKLAPATQGWATDRSRRFCASTLSGMLACSLCSLLEAFLAELAHGNPELELHRRSDGTEWLRAVEAVFGVELEPALRETLVFLVDARREFSHEPIHVLEQLPLAEAYAAWPQACVLLAVKVVKTAASPGQ